MAEHKAPTAVTLAPHEERSGFAEWVDRNWKLGAIIAVVITAAVLFWEYQHQAKRAALDESWNRLMSVATQNPQTGAIEGSVEELSQVATELKGSDAAPWAVYLAATNALSAGEYEKASEELSRLRSEFKGHPLVETTYPFVEGSAPQTIPEYLQGIVEKRLVWQQKHPALFANPDLPEGSPRVRITTDVGQIVVGLYEQEAPKHVENFLKLCRDGFYNGTKFHRIVPGFMIQGGDPNTKTGEPDTWGQGGPGYKIDFEENPLVHFRGYLSAAKKSFDKNSSGSQFFITTGAAHHLDGQHVVFGKVLEGMDVVDKIEAGAVVQGTERPVNPVSITSTEVL
jgi:cyclophilin family peptidyl-prolyl cis-trans isomerase